MKKLLLVTLFLLPIVTVISHAQEQSVLTCGDTIAEQFFSDDMLHAYTINVDSGTRLIIHTDPLPLTTPMSLTIEVRNANDAIIPSNRFSPEDGIATIETDTILSGGEYNVIVTGNTPGVYQLFVSCVDDDGTVTTGNNLVESLSCGEQIDNSMIRPDELHRYYLLLEEDTVMDVFLEALYGDFAEMTFEMGLYSPTNQELNRISPDFRGIESQILEQTVTDGGLYRLYVQGFDSSGEDYRISVDCTLPDGSIAISGSDNRRVLQSTVLQADNMPVPDTTEPPPSTPEAPPPPSQDIPTVVDVPETALIEGIPNTGRVTVDPQIVAYTFEGQTDEAITLNFVRVRGDSHIDVWMTSPDGEARFGSTLEIVDELSAMMTLPDTGTFTVYVALIGEEEVVFTVEVMREG